MYMNVLPHKYTAGTDLLKKIQTKDGYKWTSVIMKNSLQ